ncbi:hypothetical protein CICLE_v10019753mg [Citrus x clementina]|uniref:Cationic amino acid transporter C-terminal domain-containing protein n=1 Tax=Citrus clementina TaxID=85681 RepID=V4TPZ1_CITCL|nr:hypothetical protein CICLE_v10019753mg [Citrus x clementina]
MSSSASSSSSSQKPSVSTITTTMAVETETELETPLRGWHQWNKQAFFPEPSFENTTSYKSALKQTYPRLKNRLFSRSTDATELITLQQESKQPLQKCLTWWDLTWLCFGSVVGSGIFVITGQEAKKHAGPAIVLSYLASGLSALLSAFCYTEFAVEIPVAGGSFSFLRVELGDFVAYIAAGNILLEAVVGAAGLARSWSSYLASMIDSNNSDLLRFKVDCFADGFNLLDPVAVLILLVCNGIALSGTRRSSWLNWISSIVSSCVIVFVIIVGFVHGKTTNLDPFLPYGTEGVFEAAAVVYWSYTGFDMVATMAEETKKPSRDIPIGLVGSMCMITAVYCLMALALTMMVKYTEIDMNAAYSIAFRQIGMNWAKYLVSVCALKGMTTSLLVGSLGQARYTTQIARAHMIPPWHNSILEFKWKRMDWLCGNRCTLVFGDFRNGIAPETTCSKTLGSSSGSMVAIIVNCNEFISHRLIGLFGIFEVHHLQCSNACLLLVSWPSCNLRCGSSEPRKIK